MSRVSVIIVNFNGRDFLGELFQSLARQTHPAYEVILVDNASADGSADYVCQNFPGTKLVRSHTNLGFAKGNNLGFAQCGGDFIALLNSDTTVDERYLAEMVRALESGPKVGAVIPKIYKAGSFPEIDTIGAAFNNLGHYWQRHYNRHDPRQFEEAREVAGLSACAVLLRPEVLAGEELFDPDFFMYGEEFELSLRLRGRGYGILYVPTAVVYHKGGQSVERSVEQPKLFQQFYSNNHRMKILAKYYPASVLLTSLPLILLSLSYWNWIFLRKGGARLFFRAIASQFQFFLKGIRERLSGETVDPKAWLPWMTHQGFREIWALKRTIQEVDYYEKRTTR